MSSTTALPSPPLILQGCTLEAERAERTDVLLQGLRNALPESLHPHLTGVIIEVRNSGRHLRDLADLSQIHLSRVPAVIDYLNVILPCFSQTLRDISGYYEDRSHSKDRRWRKMYHEMSNELPGTSLPARFAMYNQFLLSIQAMLTKSPTFDFNGLELLKSRILQLRAARNIPPPTPVQSSMGPGMDLLAHDTNSHWAESIFTQGLPSRRDFPRPLPESVAVGPMKLLGSLRIAPDARTLIKRSFDSDQISVSFFLQGRDQAPFLLLRSNKSSQTWVALMGAHELCIERNHKASLRLSRWSQTEQRGKSWAVLSFSTWEELVLFHCTFVGLKARSLRTVRVSPDEYNLAKERKLFQAQIMDDGFKHSLMVYQDPTTHGMRLHAAVWEGELRSSPVWTAFIAPKTVGSAWLIRKSRHRIWLRDIQPYVFCPKYRPSHQVRGKSGFFELEFAKEEGATRFKEVFAPPTETTTVTSEGSPVAGPSGQ